MMVARWQFQARFGYKDQAIKSIRKWYEEIGTEIGWPLEQVRIVTGSVGASEALIECEVYLKDMNELDESWAKLAKMKKHKAWSKQFEKLVVSGTAKWEFFRLV